MTTREKPGPTPVLSGDPWFYLQGVGGIGADVLAQGVGGIGADVLAHGVGGIGADVLARAFKPMALVTTKSANTATAETLLIDPPKGNNGRSL
jgi:hypothetical protein